MGSAPGSGELLDQTPGGHGPTIGAGLPGIMTEQVPSAFFITPGIDVGVPEPVAVGAAVVVGAGVGAGAGAG
jgi:hypothetical protein